MAKFKKGDCVRISRIENNDPYGSNWLEKEPRPLKVGDELIVLDAVDTANAGQVLSFHGLRWYHPCYKFELAEAPAKGKPFAPDVNTWGAYCRTLKENDYYEQENKKLEAENVVLKAEIEKLRVNRVSDAKYKAAFDEWEKTFRESQDAPP